MALPALAAGGAIAGGGTLAKMLGKDKDYPFQFGKIAYKRGKFSPISGSAKALDGGSSSEAQRMMEEISQQLNFMQQQSGLTPQKKRLMVGLGASGRPGAVSKGGLFFGDTVSNPSQFLEGVGRNQQGFTDTGDYFSSLGKNVFGEDAPDFTGAGREVEVPEMHTSGNWATKLGGIAQGVGAGIAAGGALSMLPGMTGTAGATGASGARTVTGLGGEALGTIPASKAMAGAGGNSMSIFGGIGDILKDNAPSLIEGGISLIGDQISSGRRRRATDRFAEETEFSPYDIRTGAGAGRFGAGGASAALSPELAGSSQDLQQFLTGIGGELSDFSTEEFAGRELDLIRRLRSDRESEQFNRFQDLLKSQGRMGTTGGAQALREFMRSQEQGDLQEELAAISGGRQEQGRLFEMLNSGIINRINMEQSPMRMLELGGQFGRNQSEIGLRSQAPTMKAGLNRANSLEDFFAELGSGIGRGAASVFGGGGDLEFYNTAANIPGRR